MNRFLVFGVTVLLSSLLMSCASNRNPFPNSDLSNENWMREVDTNPYAWTQGADAWFLRGDANAAELQNRQAPYSAAISTMMVRVPDDFTRIQINGAFQVQIFGTYEHNSVYIYGSNDAIREMAVNIHGDTLNVFQTDKAPSTMRDVIVRIGIRNLTDLTQGGCRSFSCGTIEGVRVMGSQMTLNAYGSGNIYLAGNLNLRNVMQAGSGQVTLLGANTSNLEITSKGSGSLNIAGRNVGVTKIVHHGSGNINIIGATSPQLKIYTDGRGKIGISGLRANLQELVAKDNTCVFITQITSPTMNIYTSGSARAGLMGNANAVYYNASGSSRIYGRYLTAMDAFVKASDSSHVNVTATNRLFASATGNASVYFFGMPANMSQFVSGNGVVIPIWSNTGVRYPTNRYKDSGALPRSYRKYHGY